MMCAVCTVKICTVINDGSKVAHHEFTRELGEGLGTRLGKNFKILIEISSLI